MARLALQTNRAANHRSGPTRQSRRGVRAVGASPPFWFCVASTNLPRSSACAHFPPRVATFLSPPISRAPVLDQSLGILSSAHPSFVSLRSRLNDWQLCDLDVLKPNRLHLVFYIFSTTV